MTTPRLTAPATLPKSCASWWLAHSRFCGYTKIMPYEPREHHPAFEEYCEAIFELEEDNLKVIQSRIAERVGVSRAAVSTMIGRMRDEGLVQPNSRTIELTDEGRQLANAVVRRHRLAERFLTDVLGLNWTDAHHEACKWEHVISPAVEKAMNRLMEKPTTCPHGNPIPGSSYIEPSLSNLSQLPAGANFMIMRIREELECTPGLLEFFESASLMPGHEGQVLQASPDGSTTVNLAGSDVRVEAFAAERILVQAS